MYDSQPSRRREDDGQGNDSDWEREHPPQPEQSPLPIPPPPIPPPPSYYRPIDARAYGEGVESEAAPTPQQRYGSGGSYGPYDSYSGGQGGYPQPPLAVPVEQLYTESRPKRNWLRIPIARPLFTGLTLVVLIGIYLPTFFSNDIARSFFGYGAKINEAIINGEWWRLFTATLLHAQIPIHIFFNGYALFMLGNDLEAFFGRGRFLAVYWLSALGGSVASFAFSSSAGVGASGAVFGLIGALAVYFGIHRGLFGKIGQMQFWNIIIVIALNIGIGLSRIFPIDNATHIGGLVVGAAVGYALCPRYALGDWRYPNARDVRDTNQGRLTWVAVALVALNVIFAFFVVLLLFQTGIWHFTPTPFER